MARVRESRSQIEIEIEREVIRQANLDADVQKLAEKVRDHWKFVEAPVDSGEYAASVKVQKRPNRKGLPQRAVVATSENAEYIEFGTGTAAKHNKRKQGGWSPVFAPGEKTAHHFGGTLDEGITE